jgi:hypothetical protein
MSYKALVGMHVISYQDPGIPKLMSISRKKRTWSQLDFLGCKLLQGEFTQNKNLGKKREGKELLLL